MEAVIGSAFTFSVLFVDALNNPIAVEDPLISVFSYSQSGVKQVLVDNQPTQKLRTSGRHEPGHPKICHSHIGHDSTYQKKRAVIPVPLPTSPRAEDIATTPCSTRAVISVAGSVPCMIPTKESPSEKELGTVYV